MVYLRACSIWHGVVAPARTVRNVLFPSSRSTLDSPSLWEVAVSDGKRWCLAATSVDRKKRCKQRKQATDLLQKWPTINPHLTLVYLLTGIHVRLQQKRQRWHNDKLHRVSSASSSTPTRSHLPYTGLTAYTAAQLRRALHSLAAMLVQRLEVQDHLRHRHIIAPDGRRRREVVLNAATDRAVVELAAEWVPFAVGGVWYTYG